MLERHTLREIRSVEKSFKSFGSIIRRREQKDGNMMSVKVGFLGGTREIGRIAIAVKTERTQLLLDYGVLFNDRPGFPMHVPPKEVDAIILAHAHLDHSGAVPIFHLRGKKPLYATPPTLDLFQVLISDFIHLSGYYLPYEYIDLQSTMQNGVSTGYGEERFVGDFQFRLLNAGHLPGSAQVLLETGEKRLLYTGDFNTADTRLLHAADRKYGRLDAVIIESTYADEDHSERANLEKKFVERVTEVVENGGNALIPAFSVGRSQEIACILSAHHFEHPVTMDGMALKVNRILMNHTGYLHDPRLFMDAVHAAIWVEGWRDRRNATKKPGVIISPAGMLKGGPAAFYIQEVGKKRLNAVFLVGYQVPGTPGRELLEKGRCLIDGKLRRVKAQVELFDFSSHCGASQLHDTIKSLEGEPKVYVVHGAEGNCERLAGWIREETGLEAVAPEAGDVYTV